MPDGCPQAAGLNVTSVLLYKLDYGPTDAPAGSAPAPAPAAAAAAAAAVAAAAPAPPPAARSLPGSTIAGALPPARAVAALLRAGARLAALALGRVQPPHPFCALPAPRQRRHRTLLRVRAAASPALVASKQIPGRNLNLHASAVCAAHQKSGPRTAHTAYEWRCAPPGG